MTRLRSLQIQNSNSAHGFAFSRLGFARGLHVLYSEIPPAEKPAKIALAALKDVPLGTPVQEIERAANAFGVDANFMKAVAKIESDFNPRERTGSYIGLFQLSRSEFANTDRATS